MIIDIRIFESRISIISILIPSIHPFWTWMSLLKLQIKCHRSNIFGRNSKYTENESQNSTLIGYIITCFWRKLFLQSFCRRILYINSQLTEIYTTLKMISSSGGFSFVIYVSKCEISNLKLSEENFIPSLDTILFEKKKLFNDLLTRLWPQNGAQHSLF